jgi:hypothetical protein
MTDVKRIVDPWVPPVTTEEMAKCLWRAERLYLNLTQNEGTPFSWENGVSYKDQDKWRYIAEHAISAPTPLDPETAADNAALIAAIPQMISALEFVRDGYARNDVSHEDYRVQVYGVVLDVLASIGRTL